MRTLSVIVLVAATLAAFGASAAVADECPQPNKPIETDRPDITNSSSVVPVGSLQNENGIDLSRIGGATCWRARTADGD